MQIWIFGKPATGDLARPFKAAPGLMSALADANAASNESTNAAEEKKEAGGAKITEIVEEEPKKSK